MMRGLIVIACLATPAMATPPDVLTIRDDPFGLSAGSVFVLRTTSDNLGQHGTERNDTFLVIRSLATGQETLLHLSTVMRSLNPSEEEGAPDAILTVEQNADATDPFKRLIDDNGVPWAASDLHWTARAAQTLMTDEALTITHPHLGDFTLPTKEALRQFDQMQRNTAAALPDYDRMAPVSNADVLTIAPSPAICTASDPSFGITDFTNQTVARARITCVDPDLDGGHSFLILVPSAQ